jgi:hypothetical protein
MLVVVKSGERAGERIERADIVIRENTRKEKQLDPRDQQRLWQYTHHLC